MLEPKFMDLEIPPRLRSRQSVFEPLEIGGKAAVFAVNSRDEKKFRTQIASRASVYGKMHNRKFTVRIVDLGEGRAGVAVWRIE